MTEDINSGGFTPPADAAPLPDNVSGNVGSLASAAANQPGMMTPPPAPAPAAPPPSPHKSLLADIVSAVGDILGGPKTRKVVDRQTGAITEVPLSRGARIANTAGMFMRGAAAGMGAKPGPGFIGRAAAAGAEEEAGTEQRQQRNLMEESENVRQTKFASEQEMLAHASLNKMNQESTRLGLDIKSFGLKLSLDQAAVVNQLHEIESLPGARMIGHFDTNSDINAYLAHVGPTQSARYAQDWVRNKIVSVPSLDGGFDVYQVPKDWHTLPVGEGKTLSIFTTKQDLKTGKPVASWQQIPAPANMTMGDFLQWQSTALKASTDQDLQKAQLLHEQAGTQHEQAETRLANLQAANQEQFLNLTKTGDVFGDPIGAPGMDKAEYNKRVDSFSKDYGKDLNQLDQAGSQLQGIIANAEKTGKLPGAASVVGLFDAIGISSAPLKGRGFRINNEIVGEHTGARNVWQTMATKLQKVAPEGTGQVVTLQQLKDYNSILQQARHDAYLGAADQSRQAGIGVRVVPQGHNTPADAQTVKLFLDMAGGNPQKATKALQASGWQVAP